MGNNLIYDNRKGRAINPKGTSGGATHIQGSIAYTGGLAGAYVPDPNDLPDGPCDAVWVTDDGAVLTVEMADSPGVVFTTPPLPNKKWVELSVIKITACSVGSVFVGWIRKPTT